MTKLFQCVGMFAFLELAACATSGPRGNAAVDAAPEPTISGVQAQKLVQDGARLVDVRSAEEYEQGHIDGAANVPIDELPARASELGNNATPVILYCRSGRRAHKAAVVLRDQGFTNVHELGAMSNWPEAPKTPQP